MRLSATLWHSIAESLGGTTSGPAEGAFPPFHRLATDTRVLLAGQDSLEGTVFIALPGSRHDGHIYVAQAAELGVGGYVLSSDWPGEDPPGHVMRVPDTLTALQALGSAARRHLKGKVVGITGSNGKTMVKEWACSLAGNDLRVSRSPGSWNSQIGVPLSLWAMDEHADVHLVEAGISMPGEMAKLSAMIQPELGVMVHFGDAHDVHFKGRAEKAKEKVTLFEGCSTVILGVQDPQVNAALGEVFPLIQDHVITCGWPDQKPSALGNTVLSFDRVTSDHGSTLLEGQWRGTSFTWRIPFQDRASLANAVTAALLVLELGVPMPHVVRRLHALKPLGMRLEHLAGIGGGTIINDTWNHDLDGLATALDALGRLPGHRRKAIILSDLVPYDADDASQAARLKAILSDRHADSWLTVGPNLERGAPGVPLHATRHFPNTQALLDSTALDALSGWDVLVKGARPFGFERVARMLESNPHSTVLDLDLGRLAHNLQRHREQLDRPIMGMVKAFAYGAGETVAVELDRLGIDRLAVAFAEEGISLRRQGVGCPIMVLNADPQRFADLRAWGLEPEIHHIENLSGWSNAPAPPGDSDAALPGVHLKVETGMHRLGLGQEHWHEAGMRCARLGLPIISVYSHLSAADDPEADSHTRAQLERFTAACTDISAGWMAVAGTPAPPFLRHIANTAGAARFPEARLDLVRIGLGLYGLDTSNTMGGLKPIGRFHTRVSHVHLVASGDPVGYGASDRAGHDRLIATLPVGYADGLPRSAGHGKAWLHCGGASCPTVGPVCMDSCMIDITGLDVHMGDPVEIFGDAAPIQALAAATDTIPYELLCRIPPRVRRRHLRT